MFFFLLYITCTFECIQSSSYCFRCNDCFTAYFSSSSTKYLHVLIAYSSILLLFFSRILLSECVTAHILQYYSYFSLFLDFQLVGSRDKKKCRQKENCDVYIIYIYMHDTTLPQQRHGTQHKWRRWKNKLCMYKKKGKMCGDFSAAGNRQGYQSYIFYSKEKYTILNIEMFFWRKYSFCDCPHNFFFIFWILFFFILPSSSLFWLLESLEFTCFRMLAR